MYPVPDISSQEIARRALSPRWQATAKIIQSGQSRIFYHGTAYPAADSTPDNWRGVVTGEVLHVHQGIVSTGSYLIVNGGFPFFAYGSGTMHIQYQEAKNLGPELRQLTKAEFHEILKKIANQ